MQLLCKDTEELQRWADESAQQMRQTAAELRSKFGAEELQAIRDLAKGIKRPEETIGSDGLWFTNWMYFHGYSRYSHNKVWCVLFGKHGNNDYRVCVLANGELFSWYQPAIRVINAWISDQGNLCLQPHSENTVDLYFYDVQGQAYAEWSRDWRWVTIEGWQDGESFRVQKEDEVFCISILK